MLCSTAATGITPAMAAKMVGDRLAICRRLHRIRNGKPLDGGKTYKVHLPPNIPAKNILVLHRLYDNQTRSKLQTDQQFPSVGSQKQGSCRSTPTPPCDVWFGPKLPHGSSRNQLGADHTRQRLEHALPPLRTARTVVRQPRRA